MSNMTRARKTWTRDEFWKMHESGIFGSNRYELIGGEIVPVAAQSSLHAIGISNVEDALDLSPHSVPDPDISVVSGSKRSHYGTRRNPTTAILVAEVSDTTLADDRAWKGVTVHGVKCLKSKAVFGPEGENGSVLDPFLAFDMRKTLENRYFTP